MQRLTKLSLRRNVEYNVQLLSINVHVINHFIVISSEDVRKRDCRKYKELYGKHFTKDLCEWAVERMENRNGTTHHYSLDEVKSIWHKYKMNDLHNANWYDVMYVMNMAYADFYGRLFTEHHECAMYAYLYISDPDGYEGIAFQRWLADIKAQDDEVPWQRFI